MLFLLAHGKGPVCRVAVFQHTAKVLAHGNLRVFGSVRYMSIFRLIFIIMAVMGNFYFSIFFRLTWEFLGLESERGGSVCWINVRISGF